jgi:integrase
MIAPKSGREISHMGAPGSTCQRSSSSRGGGSVGYLWRKAKVAAGVNYRLHDLRHFYASGLIAARCDVVTVQRALGHSSAAETLKTYAHLWPDANDRTRQASRELYLQATAYPMRTGTS